MNDYIQKTDLTEKQRLIKEQLDYSSKQFFEETKRKESFSLSNIIEHEKSIHKLVHDLKKEFELH